MKRTRKIVDLPPTGLCIDERQGVVVLADYASDGGFDIHRAVIDERRAVNVTSPQLRTVVCDATAHSQFVSSPVTAADSDETILSALIDIVQDQHAVANFTRAGDNRLLLTQADQLTISETNQRIEKWLDNQQPTHVDRIQYALRVETRTRAIARTWHLATPPVERSVAFLVLGHDDYALALWSEETSLAFENEESFEAGANVQIKCQFAVEQFLSMVGTGTTDNLNIPPVAKAIISAPDDCQDHLVNLLLHHPRLSHINISPISLANEAGVLSPIDQPAALAIGALLDDPQIPTCDLNVTLNEQLERIRDASSTAAQLVAHTQSARAVTALLIPIIAVLAFVISSYVDRVVERTRLEQRIAKEEIIGKQLEKENADYESSKSNFAAFQSLLSNLIALRQRQPAVEQLLRDLNQRWPRETSWFISEINVKGSSVEIKGKTRNQQAIATFAKALEFSDGLFTNILAKNSVQNVAQNAAQPIPSPESNVIEFTVNATYGPLATPTKAADPSNTQSTPATNVAAAQTPVATPPSLPAPPFPSGTPNQAATTKPSPQSGVNQ